MNKNIVLSLCFLLFFVSHAYSKTDMQIQSFVKAVDITGPDKVKNRYVDIDAVPDILYSSSIAAYGGVVNLSLLGSDIVLKNSQRIYISKDPVEKEIRISKIENLGDCQVIVDLPVNISIGSVMTVLLDYNSIVSFKQKDFGVCEFRVVYGTVSVKIDGTEKKLSAGEKFEYELIGGNEDAI